MAHVTLGPVFVKKVGEDPFVRSLVVLETSMNAHYMESVTVLYMSAHVLQVNKIYCMSFTLVHMYSR